MSKEPEDFIDIDPRPGMVAVACIVGAFLFIVAALVLRAVRG